MALLAVCDWQGQHPSLFCQRINTDLIRTIAFAQFKFFWQHFRLFQISEILDSQFKSNGERPKSQYHSYLVL
jgi:hypothetical protein